jgi:hypothetical protein
MEFTLTVTEQEVAIIGNALAELPFKISSTLIANLQQQINLQQSQMAEKAPVDE